MDILIDSFWKALIFVVATIAIGYVWAWYDYRKGMNWIYNFVFKGRRRI